MAQYGIVSNPRNYGGVSVNPQQSRTMPGNTNRPGVSWPVGGVGGLPLPGRNPAGGVNSNDSVVQAYVPLSWDNGQHLRITDKHLVFIQRSTPEKGDVANMFTLPQLNNMFKRLHAQFLDKDRANSSEVTGITDVPENLVESFSRARNDPKQTALLQDTFAGKLPAIELLRTGKWQKWLTKDGIVRNLNFLGVVQNTARATKPYTYALSQHETTGSMVIVNVNVANRAFVSNIWGSTHTVRQGTKLFLILKRGPNRTAFKVVPYASAERDYPPDYMLSYIDLSGAEQWGHYWYVGTVSDALGNSQGPYEPKRRAALGINSSEQSAHDATGSLPDLTVQLRI